MDKKLKNEIFQYCFSLKIIGDVFRNFFHYLDALDLSEIDFSMINSLPPMFENSTISTIYVKDELNRLKIEESLSYSSGSNNPNIIVK